MNTSKNKTALLLPLLVSTLLFTNASNVFAHDDDVNQGEENQCNLSINSDLSVSKEHVRIIKNDETVIDIYQDKAVFVKGEQIELTSTQQAMVMDYSVSIRNSVPEVTEIAMEAVGLAFEGVNIALGEFVDLDENEEKFKQLQQKINKKYQSDDGSFTVTEGDFGMNIDDEEIDALVEEMVEDMVPDLVGGLLSTIGKAMVTGGDIDSEFDGLEQRIESEIEAKADLIEVKADAFCQKMKRLNTLEQELISIDSHFDLLEIED